MTAVPLRYRSAELVPGAVAAPPARAWRRFATRAVAAGATFAASVATTLALRSLL
jgi:hypothetical protein